MQTVSGYDTRMRVGATSTPERGIWRNGQWRQDASLVANSIMELKTHNCFFFWFLFFNSWSILKLVVPNTISYGK